MREVSIRRAGLADLPQVQKVLDEVDALHRTALPWLLREVDEPRSSGLLQEYVSKEDRTLLLAMSDAAVAGVLYVFLREPARAPIVRPSLVAEIDVLGVSSDFRRRGIGSRLVQAAREWAKQQGAKRIELGVYEFNDAARAFWASVGFETLSRRLVAHCL
jgi:ribosomal protein S18 acetylase RimI-like enzyme